MHLLVKCGRKRLRTHVHVYDYVTMIYHIIQSITSPKMLNTILDSICELIQGRKYILSLNQNILLTQDVKAYLEKSGENGMLYI